MTIKQMWQVFFMRWAFISAGSVIAYGLWINSSIQWLGQVMFWLFIVTQVFHVGFLILIGCLTWYARKLEDGLE